MSMRKSSRTAANLAAQAAQMDWLNDLPAQGLSAETAVQWLHAWAELGWLRRLDSALATQLHRLDVGTGAPVLVAAALLAQMEGRGHTCLALHDLATPPLALLAWPAEVVQASQGVLALWRHMPTGLADWLAALQAAPAACLRMADAPDLGQPLVLGGTPQAPLLYLRRYRAYEERVGLSLLARAKSAVPVPEDLARAGLNRFFGESVQAGDSQNPTDWQKLACAVALRANLAVITGGPGTGKTYTAARLLALLLSLHQGASPLRVALAAPTGKAAARLKQSIDGALQSLRQQAGPALDLDTLIQRIGPARTLHALLGARPDTRLFRHHADHLLDVDVLIVDEASMVHLEMMDALLQALQQGAPGFAGRPRPTRLG